MPGLEWIGKEERDGVLEVMDRGAVLFRYGFDEKRKDVFKVREFEESFAKILQVNFAQAVSSGSAAVRVALGAMGIQPGDEVIVPCFTFVATLEAVLEAGAVPVVAEINETLNIDPLDIEKKITEKTKAIVPVHMLGVVCQMNQILEIAKKHNLAVIEDTAQACGSTYFGKKAGTLGDMGTFSFDYVKTMTCGEGGMVITNERDLYERASQVADHGHMHDPSVPRGLDPKQIYGFNFRMNELSAAIGIAQLNRLDQILATQRKNKQQIKKGLETSRNISFRPMEDPDGDGGDTLVMVLDSAENAEKFSEALVARKVGTKILPDALGWHFFPNWPQIYSRIPAYQSGNTAVLFETSRAILNRCVAIPIGLCMDEGMDSLIQNLQDAAREAEG